MSPPVISPTVGWIDTTLFIILFLGALVLFALRAGQLVTLLAKARPEDRTDHIDVPQFSFGQRTEFSFT